MFEVQRIVERNALRITATASTPVELVQFGLAAILGLVRGDRADQTSAGTAAVSVRGQGPDLERLFADLAADLVEQITEFGPGLDDVRLDGILQTDRGGLTAWGYLTGTADAQGPVHPLTIGPPTIERLEHGLRLTCDVQLVRSNRQAGDQA